jgi:hypothetical protein
MLRPPQNGVCLGGREGLIKMSLSAESCFTGNREEPLKSTADRGTAWDHRISVFVSAADPGLTHFGLRERHEANRLRARMTASASFRVVHVFPDSARLSCGPCNAILAIMESQISHGMDVRGISPVNNKLPVAQRQPIDHLPIREVDFGASGLSATAMVATAEDRGSIFHFQGIASSMNRLAWKLKQAGLPYVFTSQCQLVYHEFIHGLKKFIYLNLVSRFIWDAGGLHFCTQKEADRAQYLLPHWSKDPPTAGPARAIRTHH